MTRPPPCADPALRKDWPDIDDERCPFCGVRNSEPCPLEGQEEEEP